MSGFLGVDVQEDKGLNWLVGEVEIVSRDG